MLLCCCIKVKFSVLIFFNCLTKLPSLWCCLSPSPLSLSQINCVTFPSPVCMPEQQLLKPNEWSYCDYFWVNTPHHSRGCKSVVCRPTVVRYIWVDQNQEFDLEKSKIKMIIPLFSPTAGVGKNPSLSQCLLKIKNESINL